MLKEEELKHVALLVLANKQDLPNAMSRKELSDFLNLQAMKNIQWHIQPCCAVNGNGLVEGLDWLAKALAKKAKQ